MNEGDRDEILFLDRPVQIVRKFRARRMTLSIRPDRPLRLTSNLTTTTAEMLRFLTANTDWIKKNIAKMQAQEKLYQKPTLSDGSLFPFLGELKYFVFSESKAGRITFSVEDGFLICYLPRGQNKNSVSSEELETQLQNHFKKCGQTYLRQRMDHWISVTGLRPLQIKFGRATTRWGSCNSKKQINLNWKLICHAPHLIDYVIVHELCHLRFLNHSTEFWSLVAEFMPEYKVYEKTLNEETQKSSFLNGPGPVSN